MTIGFAFDQPPAELAEHFPGAIVLAEVQPLPFAAGPLASAEQPGRQHPRVVEDEQIAGSEQVGQVEELAVFQRAVAAADDQQPRPVALGGRFLGDQLRREVVIEEGHAVSRVRLTSTARKAASELTTT